MIIIDIAYKPDDLMWHKISIGIFPGIKLDYFNVTRQHIQYRDVLYFIQAVWFYDDSYYSININKTSDYFDRY